MARIDWTELQARTRKSEAYIADEKIVCALLGLGESSPELRELFWLNPTGHALITIVAQQAREIRELEVKLADYEPATLEPDWSGDRHY